MNAFWLFLILRILKNYLFTSIKKDERSDDEDEEEEEEELNQAASSTAAVATGTEQASLTARSVNAEKKTPQVMVNGQPVKR